MCADVRALHGFQANFGAFLEDAEKSDHFFRMGAHNLEEARFLRAIKARFPLKNRPQDCRKPPKTPILHEVARKNDRSCSFLPATRMLSQH